MISAAKCLAKLVLNNISLFKNDYKDPLGINSNRKYNLT